MNKWQDEMNYLLDELDYHESGCSFCTDSHRSMITCEDRKILVGQFNFAFMNWIRE